MTHFIASSIVKLHSRYPVTLLLWLLVFSQGGCSRFLPSNDRNWITEHRVLPRVQFADRRIEICNVRDFEHVSKDCSVPRYRHATIDVCQITGVDLYVCHSMKRDSVFAHTMLTFVMEQSQDFLSISVEARREVGEEYNPITGMVGQFDLIYVVATERDVVDLRVTHRNERLYRYPIVIPKSSEALLQGHDGASTSIGDDTSEVSDFP